MIVAEVDPSGLRKWVDYIPVETAAAVTETYNDAGAKAIEILADTTGLRAWVDYIPVVTTTGANWRSDDGGVIPVFEGDAWSASVDDYPAPPVTEQRTELVVGESTDELVRGFNSYDEAVNGVTGSPFGSLTPDTLFSVVFREFDWAVSGGDTLVTIIVNATDDPGFTSFAVEGWTTFLVSEATSSAGGNFDSEDIWQYVFTLVGVDTLPLTVGNTYTVTIV